MARYLNGQKVMLLSEGKGYDYPQKADFDIEELLDIKKSINTIIDDIDRQEAYDLGLVTY